MTFLRLIFLSLVLISLYGISSSDVSAIEHYSNKDHAKKDIAETLAVTYSYEIINMYPHDPRAFTQGLVCDDGILYEGTGRYGHSSLRKIILEKGQIIESLDLPSEFFGEGITIFRDKIIQLTWRSHIGFVYSKKTFKLIHKFSYPTEGWGITNDGKRIIMSDGTEYLHFLDPETFKILGRLRVYDNELPVTKLNELEYIDGQVFANVWQTSRIAIIHPDTGQVTGWIELEGLLELAGGDRRIKTPNGIAHDAMRDRLFVTGKLWPKIYEIKLIPSN